MCIEEDDNERVIYIIIINKWFSKLRMHNHHGKYNIVYVKHCLLDSARTIDIKI